MVVGGAAVLQEPSSNPKPPPGERTATGGGPAPPAAARTPAAAPRRTAPRGPPPMPGPPPPGRAAPAAAGRRRTPAPAARSAPHTSAASAARPAPVRTAARRARRPPSPLWATAGIASLPRDPPQPCGGSPEKHSSYAQAMPLYPPFRLRQRQHDTLTCPPPTLHPPGGGLGVFPAGIFRSSTGAGAANSAAGFVFSSSLSAAIAIRFSKSGAGRAGVTPPSLGGGYRRPCAPKQGFVQGLTGLT